METSEFCEDMSKSIMQIMKHYILLTKTSYFSEFLTFCKTLESDGQEIKISTRIRNCIFWVKYAVFIENEN